MDATCTIQDSIHVFNLVHKYVSRILGTYHLCRGVYVFVGRVEPVIRSEMCHIIHAEMLSRLFTGFSASCFSLSRPLCSVNLSWTNSARSESPDWAVEFWNFRFLLVKPLRAALSPT